MAHVRPGLSLCRWQGSGCWAPPSGPTQWPPQWEGHWMGCPTAGRLLSCCRATCGGNQSAFQRGQRTPWKRLRASGRAEPPARVWGAHPPRPGGRRPSPSPLPNPNPNPRGRRSKHRSLLGGRPAAGEPSGPDPGMPGLRVTPAGLPGTRGGRSRQG